MYISLNWLRELVDYQLSELELADTLTNAGFEVESIEDRRTWADGVVVGKVLTKDPHPNADKLSVCTVDVGAESPLQIVCGAANVCADIYVPVAVVGTYLPVIDLKIKPAKLRGVPSQGMICSLAELGLAKESSGIHIFAQADDPQSPQVGIDVRPLLGLDDVILDLTSTANRADALSMVGIAREVAALTGAKVRIPQTTDKVIHQESNKIDITIADSSKPLVCPVYSATTITGITIARSPQWLERRLQSAGIRPINNVVDVTNYILLEWGQPLHAFDADKLQALGSGKNLTLGVRQAQTGENLNTLDGTNRELNPQNLLITAYDVPVALAGVMGGENTEVYQETKNIVLEAAIFDSVVIRRSARSQGIRTESSTRYERGVNLAELELALNRAITLIIELAGGKVIASGKTDFRPDWINQPRVINLRLERINQILGPLVDDRHEEITGSDVEGILTSLGCQLVKVSAESDVWSVTIPTYRYRDLEREIDLIEEVARLYGYNKFAETLTQSTTAGYLSIDEELTRAIRTAFRGAGLTEVMHYSYAVDKSLGDKLVTINNPMFTEYSALRSDLISGLINSFKYNLEQGNGPLQGFEIGKIFYREEDGLTEAETLAGIMGGDPRSSNWVTSGKVRSMTWYEAKGILEMVFNRLGLDVEYQADNSDARLHPGRTATLWLQGERLGIFGQLHPQLRQEKDLPETVYVFQLSVDVMINYLMDDSTEIYQSYSVYPGSSRDIAFFAPVNVSFGELKRSIKKVGNSILESVNVFDEYRGDNVPTGQRSLALRLVYRDSSRTLTDADIEPVHQKVRDILVDKFHVDLRS